MVKESTGKRIGQGKPGPGRPKGSPNKTTVELKQAILDAASGHGEDDNGKGGLTGYLRKVAREDVKAFCGLLGRVVPLGGDPDSPLGIVFRNIYETKP